MNSMVPIGTALLAVVAALPVGGGAVAVLFAARMRPPRSVRRPPRGRHYRGAHR